MALLVISGRAEGLAGVEVRARADVPTGMSHFMLCPHEYEHFFFQSWICVNRGLKPCHFVVVCFSGCFNSETLSLPSSS